MMSVGDSKPKKVSRKAATVGNLVYQYVTIALTIVNGILLVPLYLKYIDYRLYGAWLSTGSIIVWLTVVDAGLADVLRQQVAKNYGSQEYQNIGFSIGTGSLCILLLGIIPFLASLLIAPFLPGIFRLESDLAKPLSVSFMFAGLSSSLVIISGGALAVLQGLQRNISVSFIYVIGAVIGICSTVWMLLSGYGLISIPLGLAFRGIFWLCANYLCVFAVSRKLRIPLGISKEYFGHIGGLTTWTFFNKLSFILFGNCDAFVIGWLMGVEMTPILVLSKRAWDLLTLFLNRIGVAFMPSMAHLAGEGDREKFKQISIRLMIMVSYFAILGAGLCFGYNRYFIQNWVGSKFYAGMMFDGIMTLGLFFTLIVWTTSKVFFAAEDIRGPSIAGVLQNCLRLVLLVLLVRWLGVLGVPLSIAISAGGISLLYFLRKWVRFLAISDSTTIAAGFRYSGIFLFTVCLCWFVSFLIQGTSWFRFIGSFSLCFIFLMAALCLIDKDFKVRMMTVCVGVKNILLSRLIKS